LPDAFPLISLAIIVFYMLDSPESGPGEIVSIPFGGKMPARLGTSVRVAL
jgi:hypothetical protein